MFDHLPSLAAIETARRLTADIQRVFRKDMARQSSVQTKAGIAKWKAADPVAFSTYEREHRRRRAVRLKASREGVAPDVLLQADSLKDSMLAAEPFICRYCRESVPERCNRVVDHVKPIAKGGKHVPGNLAPACRSCNSRKNAATNWVG